MKIKALEYALFLLIVLLFVLLLVCKKEDNQDFINKGMTIESDTIRKLELNRGVLTMRSFRNKIHLLSWCPLQYKNTFPSWIKDKSEPDFPSKKYIFKPCISDIDLPYEIYKRKDENHFFIVKNKDTLKFKIVE